MRSREGIFYFPKYIERNQIALSQHSTFQQHYSLFWF